VVALTKSLFAGLARRSYNPFVPSWSDSGPEAKRSFRMLKFYYNGSPNPTKVALFLEEAGVPYEAIPVDTRKGDQFAPD